MTTPLPPRPSPEFLRKQAKHLLQAHKARDASVCAILRHLPRFAKMSDQDILTSKVGLQEVQHALAHEYGYITWKNLVASINRQKEGAMNDPKKEFKILNDLLSLDDRSIQLILRETQPLVLALCLLRQGPEVKELFLRNMSKRAVTMIETDMEKMKTTPELVITEAVNNMLYTATWVMEKELSPSPDSRFMELKDLLRLYDRVIQRILREIDSNDLACVLCDQAPEVREVFLRNMSTRARKMIEEDISAFGQPKPETVQKALKKLLTIADRLAAAGEIVVESTDKPEKPSAPELKELQLALAGKPIQFRDARELIPVLKSLSEFSRKHGLLALESVVEKSMSDEFLKKGLDLVIDGYDPAYLMGIMGTAKKTALAEYEKRLDVILTGVLAIQQGDHPGAIEEKCRAYLKE